MSNGQKAENRKVELQVAGIAQPPYRDVVVCPHCGASISPDAIQGPFAQRQCPECAGSLSYEAFQEKAIELQQQMGNLAQRGEMVEYALMDLTESLSRPSHAWAAPLQALRRWRARDLERRLAAIDQAYDYLQDSLAMLARSYYHASEWYLHTRRPLQRVGIGAYRIVPGYEPGGRFFLEGADDRAHGVLQDFRMFFQVESALCDPESPFFGLSLHLYFKAFPPAYSRRSA